MSASAPRDVTSWADVLEYAVARTPGCCVDRVVVLAQTASTQDAAATISGGRPGLLVVAGRQTAGRGRHGRVWADTLGLGLAATFVVFDDRRDAQALSACAGVAVLDAVAPMLDATAARPRLKRPNDLLAVDHAGARKLAGVLIERRGGLVLAGFGVNVNQRDHDWPDPLRASAVSLAQLGVEVSPVDVARRLIGALTGALAASPAEIDRRWAEAGV